MYIYIYMYYLADVCMSVCRRSSRILDASELNHERSLRYGQFSKSSVWKNVPRPWDI